MSAFIQSFCSPYDLDKTPSYEPEDLRMRHLFSNEITPKTRFILVGFPFDKGVRLNGGRPGARFAPNAIRGFFYNFVAENNLDYSFFCDAGNLQLEDLSVEQAQLKLGNFIHLCFQANIFPIVLGGGHETSFGHFLGYALSNKPVHIINFDAHTDVRVLKNESAHSGSPFLQAKEHASSLLVQYDVIGAQEQSVSIIHRDKVRKSGQLQFKNESHKSPILQTNTLLTIDLDVFHQSIMPGVSAPNPNGFLFDDFWKPFLPLLKSENIHSIDLVELNPLVDINQTSTRFAAFLLWKIVHELLSK